MYFLQYTSEHNYTWEVVFKWQVVNACWKQATNLIEFRQQNRLNSDNIGDNENDDRNISTISPEFSTMPIEARLQHDFFLDFICVNLKKSTATFTQVQKSPLHSRLLK